mmetsp:Transcript_6196/g.14437  ORF Transcript_6196/g.14437 Transcript_6196/m.14437 type:complete len:324 (+) Transcript_6196:1312-2283(+)
MEVEEAFAVRGCSEQALLKLGVELVCGCLQALVDGLGQLLADPSDVIVGLGIVLLVQSHRVQQHRRRRRRPYLEDIDSRVGHSVQKLALRARDDPHAVQLRDQRERLLVRVLDPVPVRPDHQYNLVPVQDDRVRPAPHQLVGGDLALGRKLGEVLAEVSGDDPDEAVMGEAREHLSVGADRHLSERACGQLLVLDARHVDDEDGLVDREQDFERFGARELRLDDGHARRVARHVDEARHLPRHRVLPVVDVYEQVAPRQANQAVAPDAAQQHLVLPKLLAHAERLDQPPLHVVHVHCPIVKYAHQLLVRCPPHLYQPPSPPRY